MTKLAKTNRVVVYHDETKDVPGENLKGHVLLFVPETLEVCETTPLFGSSRSVYNPGRIFYNEILRIRENHKCEWKLHFADIGGNKWSKHDQVALEVVTFAVEAMRTKDVHPPLKQPLAFKLAVMFYPKGADLTLYGGDTRKEKRLRHDETVLRILLKGAAHFLYSEENRVEVLRIVCDGKPEHRPFSEKRILWQLLAEEDRGRTPLRNYVSLNPNAVIEHLLSDHKRYEPGSPEHIHANFLQVADLLLGAVRYSCYKGIRTISRVPRIGEECTEKRSSISAPVWEMLRKVERGPGFKHSGHYRTFTIGQVEFEDDQIIFKPLGVKHAAVNDSRTMELLFDGP